MKTALALAILGASSLSSFAGAPVNNSVQIFKGTISSHFTKLEAGTTQKGSYTTLVYYIQSRSESTETVIVVNTKTKTFFIENVDSATFTLGNNNKNLFNIRNNDLRDIATGTGSLLGNVAPGTFSGVTIDFHTPTLNYEFDSVSASGSTLYLSTHDKSALKINRPLMKTAYSGGSTTVSAAATAVINYLASKGYSGLA